MKRLIVFSLMTFSVLLFAPDRFDQILNREMSNVEIARFAALIRETHPERGFEVTPDITQMTEEEWNDLLREEQKFNRDGLLLTKYMQRILPRNIVKLAESYPRETILFIHAACENGAPMAEQLNALLYAIKDPEVRRAAAESIWIFEATPAYRKLFFDHINDSDRVVRESLFLQLHAVVKQPLTTDEAAKLQILYDQEEGNDRRRSQIAESVRILGAKGICGDVSRTADP